MDNLRYLLAAIVGLTLIMSVVSGVNPSYFAGMNAFADHDDDDNSGSSNDDDHDEEDHDDDDNSGSGHDDDDDHDDDSEKDDDDKEKERGDDKDKLVRSLGDNSKATLDVDDHAELEIEIEDGDLEDGIYDVMFACDSPDVDEEFSGALEVEDGEGEFEQDLPLTNGTYTGCEVEVGDLAATFPSFTIMANDDHDDRDDDHDDDDHDDDNKDREEREHEREHKVESKLEVEDDGVVVEVEVEGLNMTDGSYDAVFACKDPDFSMTLNDAFEVEDGEGKLEEMIGLENGTYSGCEITVEGNGLASFRTFTVSEESDDDEQEQRIKEKRKEKEERIVTTINGTTIHERHRSTTTSSPGEYDPGWDYALMAAGTANETADATVDIDLGVWKSNSAVILLDVIGGTVEIENQTYTVVLGYALHSINHDTFRVGALAVDDDGNVYKLKMRGSAIDDEAEFPAESGSIELTFNGSSNNRFGDWELTMDGTITAS